MTSTQMRLAHEDSTYWLLSDALGWSVVLQLVWRIDGPVTGAVLLELNSAFAQGRLHRRLMRPRLPGARPYWVGASDIPELCLDDAAIPVSDVDGWAQREMTTVPLNPLTGNCWRLRAGVTDSGDTVISLCALHLVTDGRGMLAAAAAAFTAVGSRRSADTSIPSGGVSARSSGAWRFSADLIDALRQVGASVLGVSRAVVASRPGGTQAAFADPRAPRTPAADRALQAQPRCVTVSVATPQWNSVATSHGGTANSLFVAVISGLLRSSGFAPGTTPIKIGVPVDRRAGGDDQRANATAGVSVTLTDDPVPGGGLENIRGACKEAFVRLSAGRRPAMIHLLPLVWLLPKSWVVRSAGAGSGMPDAVTSNLGEIPDAAQALPGHRGVAAFRGIAQGVDPQSHYRFGDGVQSWLISTPQRMTFSVLGFDETSFPSGEVLAKLLADELSAWGIDYEIW